MALDHHTESRALADWYPYWSRRSGKVEWAQWANEAMRPLPADERYVDPVAVLSLLSFEFVCLDRTLVEGISRLPWLGGVDDSGEIYTFQAPPHGDQAPSPGAIADELWRLLCAELREAVKGKSRAYMLLSGGMDSRVVAGALRSLQHAGHITVPIEAVTWGIPATRDVVYAERLAQRLGWSWTHLPLTSADYWDNFELTADFLGAECDPKHLHRMGWFQASTPNSVVIAGSYGDSIGRAEYSSTHLRLVEPLRPWDRFQLLRPEWRAWATPRLQLDILGLRGRHGIRSEVGYRELERQAHYMRRQLCHPMCIINRWARVHQAFTSPALFGYMWSLSPSCRNDTVYRSLLEKHTPDLLGVEWARTGGRFAEGSIAADRLPKAFHRYGEWLRVDHAEKIHALLTDGELERLEVFDMDQVRFMLGEWRKERPSDNTMLSTQLSMLATLSICTKRFGLRAPSRPQRSWLPAELLAAPLKHASRLRQRVARLSRPYRIGG